MSVQNKRYKRGIMATCCLPWDEELRFLEDVFRRQVRQLLARGAEDLYIFGTAGEGYAVSDVQFDRITGVFCEEMVLVDAQPIVGVISLSVPTIVRRIEQAYRMGVRFFQISLPGWGACNVNEIRSFFDETCGRFPDCRFMHYNNPRTKRIITPKEYAQLAERHDNFVAVKSGADSLSQIVSLSTQAPRLRYFFTEAGFSLASLLGLEAGLLISIASINWAEAKRFFQAGIERDMEVLSRYALELTEITGELFRLVGDQGHIDGVFDKIFARMADSEFPLRLLPPYSCADERTYSAFVAFLSKNFARWINKPCP